jgi:hypothetical protein
VPCTGGHPACCGSSVLRSPRSRQYPCEWAPGLGSAKPIACDATVGSDLDAVTASWTTGSEAGGCAHHRTACRASHLDQRALRLRPGVRRGGPPKAEPGADAGPAAPQALPWQKSRYFGNVRKLPSGRLQARYRGPDGRMRTAARTFARKSDASRWLTFKEAEVRSGDWIDPDAARVTFGACAEQWIRDRVLKARIEELYRGLLRNHLLLAFGDVSIGNIDEAAVRRWRKERLQAGPTATRPFGPVVVAKAYRLLHAIFTTAVDDLHHRSMTGSCDVTRVVSRVVAGRSRRSGRRFRCRWSSRSPVPYLCVTACWYCWPRSRVCAGAS